MNNYSLQHRSSLSHQHQALCILQVGITFPLTLKSPKPSRVSLVTYSLYKLDKIGDKHHPCLTLLPLSPSMLFLWSILNWTLIHVQYIDQSSFAPLLPRVLQGLLQFGPGYSVFKQKKRIKRCTCSNTQTIISVIKAESKEKNVYFLPVFANNMNIFECGLPVYLAKITWTEISSSL